MSAVLPNIKRLFIPDPKYTLVDSDLDRADLQVVVWEAGDEDLKAKLREGVDLHTANAADIYGASQAKANRAKAKAGVHATNYGAYPRTLSKALGITVKEAEFFQHQWFGAHPGIKEWHRRVEESLVKTRAVRNAFGFRRLFFDRIDSVLPQALAWIPQSTVAIVTNMGLRNLHQNLPEVQVLLQVHDSTVWQAPSGLFPGILSVVRENLLIPVPYEDPLVIPVGFKLSTKSWGDCQEVEVAV